MPELFFEPAHHPIAAEDLDLDIVPSGDCRRIRRNERRCFDVARRSHVDGRGRAVAQACGRGIDTAGAEHLARLVGRTGHDGRSRRHAGRGRRFGGDFTQDRSRREEFGEHLRFDAQRLPLPIVLRRPREFLEIKRHVSNLRAGGIDESAGQPVIQIAGEQQKLVRCFPDLRLVRGDPVGFGFALKIAHGFGGAG